MMHPFDFCEELVNRFVLRKKKGQLYDNQSNTSPNDKKLAWTSLKTYYKASRNFVTV